MTVLGNAHAANSELVETGEFFAPTPHGLVDGLLGEYQARRAQIEQVAELFKGDIGGVVSYFLDGNKDRGAYSSVSAENIFRGEGAIASLNSDYWGRALSLTDIYDCMPQTRRNEWNEVIREKKAPEFNEETVRATLEDLLAAREKFMAERVDGIFRALSGEHVTNRPEGFYKRMIIGYVFNGWGYTNHDTAGFVHDLRLVIGKFMGRHDVDRLSTNRCLQLCREDPGQWHEIDGGALRVRAYIKGTAHLEVHPEMAWRLNATLASLYPLAIPANKRQRPAKTRTFKPIGRPLPGAVLQILADIRNDHGKTITLPYAYSEDRHVAAEVRRVLEMIGGVIDDSGSKAQFEYCPREVLREIQLSGCIPDRVSSQFYPTPDDVAEQVIDMAQIQPQHTCLEPSAGTGALAKRMPETTVCVEQAAIFCAALSALRRRVIRDDFIQYAARADERFDRIVMNPPFADGRAVAHVQAAAKLLAANGRLVAVVPASMRGKVIVEGADHAWSEALANRFANTSIAVAIVAITKPA